MSHTYLAVEVGSILATLESIGVDSTKVASSAVDIDLWRGVVVIDSLTFVGSSLSAKKGDK